MRDSLFSLSGISPNIQGYKFKCYSHMRVDLCLLISRKNIVITFLLALSYLVSLATITKYHGLVNNRNLFRTVLEARKPRSPCWSDRFHSGASSLGL